MIVATYTTSSISVGVHFMTASYAGDSNYTSATSKVLSLRVNVGAPTASLTASSTTITYGASVTLTAKLTGGAATPTGTVTFLNGSTALGASSLNSSGLATYVATTLPEGNNGITASLLGRLGLLSRDICGGGGDGDAPRLRDCERRQHPDKIAAKLRGKKEHSSLLRRARLAPIGAKSEKSDSEEDRLSA